ncbi:MAG: hypothetical protein WCX27_01245 [Candidatus Paceibacterota bacterium]|jgi:antitoxin component of RelBE/YafQ-DinJ toxin-antitoxin module
MDKTIINIKTDRYVKEGAQSAARELGLPLGTIINAYLRELAREKRVIFSVPPTPNVKLRALLKTIYEDSKKKTVKGLSYAEAVEHLNRI